jgi:hypothetical protein
MSSMNILDSFLISDPDADTFYRLSLYICLFVWLVWWAVWQWMLPLLMGQLCGRINSAFLGGMSHLVQVCYLKWSHQSYLMSSHQSFLSIGQAWENWAFWPFAFQLTTSFSNMVECGIVFTRLKLGYSTTTQPGSAQHSGPPNPQAQVK